VERGKAADRARVAADKVDVAWAFPLRLALSAPACVRNAGIVNRMSAECLACRSSARSVEPP
jgi:hypothetical protein